MENKQTTKVGWVNLKKILIKAPHIKEIDPESDELPESGTQLRFSPKFMADSLGNKHKK